MTTKNETSYAASNRIASENRALTRTCPTCGSRPGERCIYMLGSEREWQTGTMYRKPHKARTR